MGVNNIARAEKTATQEELNMLITENIHKRSSLMTSKKEDLVKHIMLIEHNNKVLQDTLNQQAENFKKLCENCPEKKAKFNAEDDGCDYLRDCDRAGY